MVEEVQRRGAVPRGCKACSRQGVADPSRTRGCRSRRCAAGRSCGSAAPGCPRRHRPRWVMAKNAMRGDAAGSLQSWRRGQPPLDEAVKRVGDWPGATVRVSKGEGPLRTVSTFAQNGCRPVSRIATAAAAKRAPPIFGGAQFSLLLSMNARPSRVDVGRSALSKPG